MESRIRKLCADSIRDFRPEDVEDWMETFFMAVNGLQRDNVKAKIGRIAEKLQNDLEQLPLNLEGTGGLTPWEFATQARDLAEIALMAMERVDVR